MVDHVFSDLVEQFPVGFAAVSLRASSNGLPEVFLFSEANPAFEKIVGQTKSSLLNKPVAEVFAALLPDCSELLSKLNRVADRGGMADLTLHVPQKGAWYKVSVFSQEKQTVMILFSDISSSMNAFSDLDVFFRITPDLMCIMDLEGCFIQLNPAWEDVLGYPVAEMTGRPAWEFVHSDDLAAGRTVAGQLEKLNQLMNFVNRYNHKDGTYRYLQWSAQRDGQKIYAVARDITESLEKQQAIEYLSYHDVLTGLYNRRFLEEEIRRLNTFRNLPISIIMGDINRLKLVNDAFGHEKGDELIRKAARSILQGCRAEDLVARWGGDEFLIFLPKTRAAEAEIIVKRIQDLAALENVNAIAVSISFGIGTRTSMDETISDAIRLAEDTMYSKKAQDKTSSRGDVLRAITSTFFGREPDEKKHATKVSALCHRTALALNMNTTDVNKIALGGLMHDIGKIAVRSETLDKPASLTSEEWAEIRTHPEVGYRIIISIPDMVEVGNAILSHHERFDGDGYPSGVKWNEIPLFAKIIALADSYATMTSNQVYKPAMSRDEAIAEIRRNEGTQFDPELAELFIERVLLKPQGMPDLN